MHKKSFRLFISTLLLSLTFLLGGCGSSTRNENQVQTNVETIPKEITTLDSNRFSAESVNISNLTSKGSFKSFSYIITDHETGSQFLYIYTYKSSSGAGGPCIIALTTTANDDKN